MKSILKKVAGVALATVLALGMFSCSNGIAYPVMETVATPEFSVASGTVNSGTEVTITCSTEVQRFTTQQTELNQQHQAQNTQVQSALQKP